MKHPDFGILIILIGFLNGVSQLFIYCYFGKIASTNYEKMAGSLYESAWVEMSSKYQKYLIVMIANAQIPIHYHGLNIAILNLETMTKVIEIITYDKLNNKIIIPNRFFVR